MWDWRQRARGLVRSQFSQCVDDTEGSGGSKAGQLGTLLTINRFRVCCVPGIGINGGFIPRLTQKELTFPYGS